MDLMHLERLFREATVVELSQLLEPHIPSPLSQGRYMQVPYQSRRLGDPCSHNFFGMGEHVGTHVDMPGHFVCDAPNERYLQDYAAGAFWGKARVIQLGDPCPPGTVIERDALLRWEETHGAFEPDDIVLLATGWDRHWAPKPQGTQYMQSWPALGEDAAQYLVDRRIRLVGLDTPSVDVQNGGYPIHNLLLGQGLLIAENLKNLTRLPAEVFYMGLPIPMKNGTAGPIRAVALY
ncbi:MAG: cyclase family protein [Eubacteriales bacterium]|jgi:kynurenine formamidase